MTENPMKTIMPLVCFFGTYFMARTDWGTDTTRPLAGVLLMFWCVATGYCIAEFWSEK